VHEVQGYTQASPNRLPGRLGLSGRSGGIPPRMPPNRPWLAARRQQKRYQMGGTSESLFWSKKMTRKVSNFLTKKCPKIFQKKHNFFVKFLCLRKWGTWLQVPPPWGYYSAFGVLPKWGSTPPASESIQPKLESTRSATAACHSQGEVWRRIRESLSCL